MSENPLAVVTGDLDPRHLQAILLKLSGRNDQQVADKMGVTPKTVRRWKKKETFQALMEFLGHLHLHQSVDELVKHQFNFLETLQEISADADQPAEDRVQAAEVGLGYLEKTQAHSTRLTPEWVAGLIDCLNQPDQAGEPERIQELYNALPPGARDRLRREMKNAVDVETEASED